MIIERINGNYYVNGKKARPFQAGKSSKMDKCRNLFKYKNILIKEDDPSYHQSTCELDKMASIAKEDKKYFATVLGGVMWTEKTPGWIAVRYYKAIKRNPSQKTLQRLDALCTEYGIEDVDYYRNWIMTSHGLKIVDWGV